jgi:hypothetical protein
MSESRQSVTPSSMLLAETLPLLLGLVGCELQFEDVNCLTLNVRILVAF